MDFPLGSLSISAEGISDSCNEHVYPVGNQGRARAELHQNKNDENVPHGDNCRKPREADVYRGDKNRNDGEEDPLDRKVVLYFKAKEGERYAGSIHAKQVQLTCTRLLSPTHLLLLSTASCEATHYPLRAWRRHKFFLCQHINAPVVSASKPRLGVYGTLRFISAGWKAPD
jgi:hypothetical protein